MAAASASLPEAPPPSWASRALQVLAGSSTLGTCILAVRAALHSQRLATLTQATPVDVDQLHQFFDGQQKILDSSYGHSYATLPPQYVSITGRTACAAPITTEFASPPARALWYSKLETQHFSKLLPFTRIQMADEQRQSAFFQTTDFLLVPSRPPAAAPTAAASAASSSASAVVPSVPVPSATPTVSIPSSLPADPRYWSLMVQQVSDTLRDVSMSSREFMEQMAAGRLLIKERNIERIVPVGHKATVIGWAYRDPSGHVSVLPGQNASAASTTAAMVPRGVTSVMVHNNDVVSAANAALTFSDPHSPDLQAYSYSKYDHPCIISSKSHARILEDERAAVSSARRLVWIGVGVTAALVLVIAGRHLWHAYTRHQQLTRLIELQAARAEKREAKLREKKEAERRRTAKRQKQEKQRELLKLKQAQVAYFNAAAAAAQATASIAAAAPVSSSSSIEGVPHLTTPSSSPVAARQNSGPTRQPTPSYGQAAPASSSSSYTPRASSPFPLPPRAPFTAADAASVVAAASLLQARSAAAIASPSSSASAIPPQAQPVEEYPDDDDAHSSSSDAGRATDDEATVSEEDEDSDSSTRHADYCLICCEQKADACLLPCSHMYTCTGCASKVTNCPVCRHAIEKIVKVFAQRL